ncbi:hypothetical protein V490_01575 [Pseudogymnoascus sp. VKM F-3557]|nr:hypothetical protein V490_01575 [Pseudogymnoascus sp. VKM F-3557]
MIHPSKSSFGYCSGSAKRIQTAVAAISSEATVTMWSTILPELMTITVWVLTFLCIRAGTKPGYLQGYAVMSINTTGLKQYESSPLYDVYNIYISTVCAGNYVNTNPNSRLTNFTCTASSSYSEFDPHNMSMTSLPLNKPCNFPLVIQNRFIDYNLQLHVAWVFYVLSMVWTGLAMLFGIMALYKGAVGLFIIFLTSSASICLFISSVIVSVVQQNGVKFINGGANAEISASTIVGLLALTWSAFALSSLSSLVWLGAGISPANDADAWLRYTEMERALSQPKLKAAILNRQRDCKALPPRGE